MGIFKRIKAITKADFNKFLDELEDPIAMLNEYSREMELEIMQAHKALSRQRFVENKQAMLILENKKLIEKRTRQAKLAIDHGEAEIAKLAVQEKLNLEQQLSIYEQQYEVIRGQTQIFKEKLNELHEFYKEMQHKKLLLASRANVAKSIKQIQKTIGSFQTDNFIRGIARVEDRILLMEAEVQTSSQFTNPIFQHNAVYLDYVNEEELNSEIEKLKNEKENQNKAV